MKTRVISGAILAVLLVAFLLLGGYYLGAATLLISLVAYYELSKACRFHEEGKKVNCLEIIGYGAIVLYYVATIFTPDSADGKMNNQYFILLIALILLEMMLYVFTFPRFNVEQIVASVFAVIYAPLMLSFIYKTREELDGGIFLAFLIFITSWISDTCAYFTGVAIGKHKLAPVLSPKKSIEGSIGGIVGAAVISGIYGWAVSKYGMMQAGNVLVFVCIGAVGSIISQVGDLAASAIKRNHDIKDYGTLIPGHGGIMDRFDSVIVTAPIIFFLAKYLMQ